MTCSESQVNEKPDEQMAGCLATLSRGVGSFGSKCDEHADEMSNEIKTKAKSETGELKPVNELCPFPFISFTSFSNGGMQLQYVNSRGACGPYVYLLNPRTQVVHVSAAPQESPLSPNSRVSWMAVVNFENDNVEAICMHRMKCSDQCPHSILCLGVCVSMPARTHSFYLFNLNPPAATA